MTNGYFNEHQQLTVFYGEMTRILHQHPLYV